MTEEQKVYDFERVLETGLQQVLSAQLISSFTSQDEFDFQKNTPRVEVIVSVGDGQLQLTRFADGKVLERAWKGNYTLQVVTAADMTVHGELRSRVRKIMHNLPFLINGTEPMTLHKLQFIHDRGSSATYSTEEGFFQTTMTYEIDFSLQADAWKRLQYQ